MDAAVSQPPAPAGSKSQASAHCSQHHPPPREGKHAKYDAIAAANGYILLTMSTESYGGVATEATQLPMDALPYTSPQHPTRTRSIPPHPASHACAFIVPPASRVLVECQCMPLLPFHTFSQPLCPCARPLFLADVISVKCRCQFTPMHKLMIP